MMTGDTKSSMTMTKRKSHKNQLGVPSIEKKKSCFPAEVTRRRRDAVGGDKEKHLIARGSKNSF